MALVNGEGPLDRALAAGWWALLAAGLALFLCVAIGTLRYPHELVVSEAAVGIAARSLVEGVPPYTQARFEHPPYSILHYTPGYYLMVGPLIALTGSAFAAGRGVSVLFTLATAGAAFAIARRLSGSWRAGAAASLLWLSFYQVAFWGTAQRVDAPGIFFEAMGLLVAVRAREAGRTPWLALPWLVAAWSVKQITVVGLVAVAADLALRDRKRALAFAAAGLGSIAAIALALDLASGGAFHRATVLGTISRAADPPWVILGNAELFFASPWNMLVFVLAAAGAVAARERLLGIALGFGLVFAVATDANFPRFYSPMLAMAVLLPLLLAKLRERRAMTRGLLAALLLFGGSHVVYEMRPLVRERILDARPGNERLALAAGVAARTSVASRILAQDTGMILSAGRRVEVADPLVLSILAGNGAFDPRILADDVRAGRFDAIVLNRPLEAIDDREWTTLWIAPVRGEIAARYRLAETLHCGQSWRFLEPDRYVYVPKDGA